MNAELREVALDLKREESEAYQSAVRRLIAEHGIDARVDSGDDVEITDDRATGGPRGAWVAAWVWVEHG